VYKESWANIILATLYALVPVITERIRHREPLRISGTRRNWLLIEMKTAYLVLFLVIPEEHVALASTRVKEFWVSGVEAYGIYWVHGGDFLVSSTLPLDFVTFKCHYTVLFEISIVI
jgi:hypothetical protein